MDSQTQADRLISRHITEGHHYVGRHPNFNLNFGEYPSPQFLGPSRGREFIPTVGREFMARKSWYLVLILLTITGSVFAQKNPKASQTAQSIEVHFTYDEAQHVIVGPTGAWDFDWAGNNATTHAAWADYFTGVQVNTPAPTVVAQGKREAMRQNKSNFFCGKPLKAVTHCDNSKPDANCFNSTPVSPGVYGPETGWTFTPGEGGGSGTAVFDIEDIFIASQSFVRNDKKSEKWTTKYSFDLLNQDMTSRVTDVTFTLIHVDEQNIEKTVEIDTPEHTVVTADWTYTATPGLTFGYAVGDLATNKDVSVILASDDFEGNNNPLGGHRAEFDAIKYEVSEQGSYKLRITGIVKGNAVIATQPFTITLDELGSVTGLDDVDCSDDE
jgi:hypothetical protein